jgi:hypothetical protein
VAASLGNWLDAQCVVVVVLKTIDDVFEVVVDRSTAMHLGHLYHTHILESENSSNDQCHAHDNYNFLL